MPRHDYQCANGHIRRNVWVSNYRDATNAFRPEDLSPCETCGLPLSEKLPAAPSFVVKGYAASNGYSRKE